MRSLTHSVTSIRLQHYTRSHTRHPLASPSALTKAAWKIEQRSKATGQLSSQSCRRRFQPSAGDVPATVRLTEMVNNTTVQEAGAANDPGSHVARSVLTLSGAPEKAQFCLQIYRRNELNLTKLLQICKTAVVIAEVCN